MRIRIAAPPALAATVLAVLLAGPLGMLWAPPAAAASARAIDLEVDAALTRFYRTIPGARRFADAAAGLLVFPSVVKAGLVIGGEYGEGALRVGGKTVAYYSTAAASIGFQAGAQTKTVIIAFMDEDVLAGFRSSMGWEIGADASVALVELGKGATLNTTNIRDPIVAFVFNNKGLMFNATIEGAKITRLDK